MKYIFFFLSPIWYNFYANKFVAGLGSIPSISSFVMTLLNIVTSGICYDAIRNFISDLKGGYVMSEITVMTSLFRCENARDNIDALLNEWIPHRLIESRMRSVIYSFFMAHFFIWRFLFNFHSIYIQCRLGGFFIFYTYKIKRPQGRKAGTEYVRRK